MLEAKSVRDSKSSYIYSIDGLRAVAVLLVLFFHLEINVVHSGFIGVDAFFVISGFLITQNIAKSVEAKRFSFLEFYFRRMARLMPTVLVVVFLTLIGGYFFLTSQDYDRLGFSSFLASISLSNIFFWTEAGYFTQASGTKPLLHTWSLAVEEQFYLIWPIFIVLCLAVRRQFLIISMAVLGVLSFLAAIYFHRSNPDMVFFLAPFRAFQFAVGGLIGFLPAWKIRSQLSIVGILSVVLLFILAAILPDDLSGLSHVVIVMLLPALLTGAFIFTARSALQEKIFASPIPKYFGDRSYAIYLAHWPIIVYWNMATDYVLTPIEQVGLFIASVAAGEVLHQCVEKPFRLSRSEPAAKVLRTKLFLLTLAVSSAFLAINVTYFNGFAKDGGQAGAVDSGPLAESLEPVTAGTPTGRCFMRPQDKPEQYGLERCATAPAGKSPRVLVFGDSYGEGAYIALKVGFKDPYFGHFLVPGCPIETPRIAAKNINLYHCYAKYDYAYKNVAVKDKFDYIVLVANWTDVSDQDLKETREHFDALGIKTIIVGLRPKFRERVDVIFDKTGDAEKARIRANNLIIDDFTKKAELMSSAQNGSLDYIDLMAKLCPVSCILETPSGKRLYKDDTHFTPLGAAWLGREIEKSYPDLFK